MAKKVVVTDRSVEVEIVLQELATQLSEVIIKPDANTAHYLNLFKAYFLGQTPNAERCRILNPEVLRFSNDETAKVLTIRASDFLIIENEALGYRIKYLLNIFECDYKQSIVYYAGQAAFEDLTGNSAKLHKWKLEREIAYQGSSGHFFRSLVKNELQQEGFLLFRNVQKAGGQRPSDSLINVKIKQFSRRDKTKGNALLQLSRNDSLNYWIKKRKESKTIEVQQTAPVSADSLLTEYDDIFKSMRFTGELIVVFTKARERRNLSFDIYRQQRPSDQERYQTSTVKRIAPNVLLYANGTLADPKSIFYKGFWAYQKMADTVPMDFSPITTK